MKNDRTIEFSLHMKVRNWSRPPSPPSLFRRIQTYSGVCRRTVAFNESLHLGVRKSLPYGRAQRLTRPKCAILGKIIRYSKNFFDRFYWEESNEKWWHHRRITSHEGEEMVATTLPPSQCWKLKCCQAQKFDHQHKIQHWSEGGRGSKSSRKLSHLCIFGAAWSAKVCRVILPKLAGSDFELSHTIFKCWQTHEIHQHLSADRCINSNIITGSNIDPRGEGGRRAPKMITFFHFSCCMKCESVSNYFPQTEGVSLWGLPYDFQVLTDARNPSAAMSSGEWKSAKRWHKTS